MFVQILASLMHTGTNQLCLFFIPPSVRVRSPRIDTLALICASFVSHNFPNKHIPLNHFSWESRLSLIRDVDPLRLNNIWTGVLSYTLSSRLAVSDFMKRKNAAWRIAVYCMCNP